MGMYEVVTVEVKPVDAIASEKTEFVTYSLPLSGVFKVSRYGKNIKTPRLLSIPL